VACARPSEISDLELRAMRPRQGWALRGAWAAEPGRQLRLPAAQTVQGCKSSQVSHSAQIQLSRVIKLLPSERERERETRKVHRREPATCWPLTIMAALIVLRLGGSISGRPASVEAGNGGERGKSGRVSHRAAGLVAVVSSASTGASKGPPTACHGNLADSRQLIAWSRVCEKSL